MWSYFKKRPVILIDGLLAFSFVLNIVLFVKVHSQKRGTCDTVWQLFEGNCYFFSNSKSNWHKARTMCLYKSADLLVIDNENEQKFISGKTGNTPYWIGLNDIEEEGNWTWVDGTDYKSSYKSWMPNEPKNTFRSEDSAQVLMGGNWDDKYCSDSSYAICEKKV